MAINGKTAFVTGGTGKIGRHLISRLVACGFLVKILTRNKGNPLLKLDNIQIIEGDILDQDTIRKAARGCDYLFHLAVYQNIDDRSKDLFQRVNVEGTKVVLNSSVKSDIKKFIYVSTAMVFEATGKIERDEHWVQKKSSEEDFYLQSKLEALAFVRQMNEVLPIVILYPPAVIDLKDFSSSAPVQAKGWQKLLWKKIGRGIPGGLIGLIGPGSRIFNYVVIEDLVEGVIQAAIAGQAGEDYILGGENISLENYLRLSAQRIHKRVFPVRIPIFPFKIISRFRRFVSIPPGINLIAQSSFADMCLSSEKAKKSFDYNPKLKLCSGNNLR